MSQVVVNPRFFLRYSPNPDGPNLGVGEGIVVDEDLGARNVRSIPSIFAPVHIEIVAQRFTQFHIVSCLVADPRNACPGNGMPIVIEKIILDDRFYVLASAVTHAIPQSISLIMMDVVVMNMMAFSALQYGWPRDSTRSIHSSPLPGSHILWRSRANWKTDDNNV